MKRRSNGQYLTTSWNGVCFCKLTFSTNFFTNDQLLVIESEVWHRGSFVSECFFFFSPGSMSSNLFSGSSSVLINIHWVLTHYLCGVESWCFFSQTYCEVKTTGSVLLSFVSLTYTISSWSGSSDLMPIWLNVNKNGIFIFKGLQRTSN